MRYPRAFFAIQLEFARKMTELAQRPYLDAILHTTAFYRLLGLDWSLDASNPVWQAYCEGLKDVEEDVEWTYQFYLPKRSLRKRPWSLSSCRGVVSPVHMSLQLLP